jgi:hypothetical protein
MVDPGRAWATKYSHAQLGSDGDRGLILDALCWLRAIYHFAFSMSWFNGLRRSVRLAERLQRIVDVLLMSDYRLATPHKISVRKLKKFIHV